MFFLKKKGLFQLIEREVMIRCRKVDIDLVKSVIPLAQAEYKKATKKDCQVTVDQNNHLSPDS